MHPGDQDEVPLGAEPVTQAGSYHTGARMGRAREQGSGDECPGREGACAGAHGRGGCPEREADGGRSEAESVGGGSRDPARGSSQAPGDPGTAGISTARTVGTQSPSGPTSSLKGCGVRTGSHRGWGLVSETLALQGPPQRAQSVHTILHGQGACSALRVACSAECLEKDVLIR